MKDILFKMHSNAIINISKFLYVAMRKTGRSIRALSSVACRGLSACNYCTIIVISISVQSLESLHARTC